MKMNRVAAWPICNGCGAEIICAARDTKPWSITVRDPYGNVHDGGVFCLPCMIEFAKLGLVLVPV